MLDQDPPWRLHDGKNTHLTASPGHNPKGSVKEWPYLHFEGHILRHQTTCCTTCLRILGPQQLDRLAGLQNVDPSGQGKIVVRREQDGVCLSWFVLLAFITALTGMGTKCLQHQDELGSHLRSDPLRPDLCSYVGTYQDPGIL